ncbi:helicase RepA family protein [Aliiroseovarius marinus]|uniref:helicase RepA family protein n=1 Tax=Aliiroseovarius marinus TaxID=2500159 RepID=UPI00105C5CEA|nr:helicase RepA family protein [Aliiroseovarius marinus]
MSYNFRDWRLDVSNVIGTKPKELDFVLPGLLAGTVGLLVAPGSVGKSFLALEFCISIAAGRDVFGLFSGQEFKKGPVCFLSLEDGGAVLHHRLYALREYLTDEDKANIEQNFDVFDASGRGFSLTMADGSLPSMVFQALEEYLDVRKPVLLVIDTLNRALSGLNESCSAVASKVLHQLEQLNRKVGCATLILHHANKSSVLNGNSTAQGIRGSSAWSDNARWQANMAVMSEAELANYEVDQDNRKSWVKLDLVKCNHIANTHDIWLTRDEHGVLVGQVPPRSTNSGRTRKRRKGGDDIDNGDIPW